MASLVLHSEEPIQAAKFSHRALFGRKAFNGVQLGQRIVSRIHCWIDRDGDKFYIRDARSRGGTFVNAVRIDGKTLLRDRDVIKIGTSNLTFHEADELPEGAIVFQISEDGRNPEFNDPGILIACEACGAPMWVPHSMAGAFGRCAICSGPITVPGEPVSGVRRPLTPNDSIVDMPAITAADIGDVARPIDPLGADFPEPKPNEAAKTCGICQSPIIAGEVTTQCTSCSQTYHAECWRENRGCAAYGCPEVGVLDAPVAGVPAGAEPELEPALAAKTEMPDEPQEQPKAFPWDFALLGGSVFGTIIGAFTFGLPALLVGTASAIYASKQRREGNYRLAAWCAVLCLFGVACGVITSAFLYLNYAPWRGR